MKCHSGRCPVWPPVLVFEGVRRQIVEGDGAYGYDWHRSRESRRPLVARQGKCRRQVKCLLQLPTIAVDGNQTQAQAMPLPTESALPPALPAAAIADAQQACAESTRRTYLRAAERAADWLELHGRPVDDGSLAEYLRHLRARGRGSANTGQVIAAVSWMAKTSCQSNPIGPQCRNALAAHRRDILARPAGQVLGVQWAEADAMAAVAAKDGPAGLRDAALVALASDCLLRVSEVAAVQVEDLQAEPDGSGRLTVRRSKTDQEGSGASLYVGPATMGRISAWREAGAVAAGPILRQIHRSGAVRAEGIKARAVRGIIQARTKAAGIEGRVSGHSLRVGAAQSLAAAGAELVEMQTAGRWRSPAMPGHYAQGQLAGRGAVARLRHKR